MLIMVAPSTRRTGSLITSGGGGFAAPDKFGPDNFTSGTSNFNNWVDWTFSAIPSDIVVDTTSKIVGANSVRKDYIASGSEQGCHMVKSFGSNLDRIYFKFKYRWTGTLPAIECKYLRVVDDSFNHDMGGIWLGTDSQWKWGWDLENEATLTDINIGAISIDTVHCIEFDYWRNGDPSGFPSVAIWHDDVQVSYANGTHQDAYNGTTHVGVWDAAGRLNAGMRQPGTSGYTMGIAEHFGTLNSGASGPGSSYCGDFAASSQRMGAAV